MLLVLITYGYTHVFSGRGAFIQVGALIGSIMVANVLFIIIPNQRKTIDALLAGREPDPAWGYQAKQRSIHNNYLTLPVVFTMLSNHYSFTYETQWNWLVLACIFRRQLPDAALVQHDAHGRGAGLAAVAGGGGADVRRHAADAVRPVRTCRRRPPARRHCPPPSPRCSRSSNSAATSVIRPTRPIPASPRRPRA